MAWLKNQYTKVIDTNLKLLIAFYLTETYILNKQKKLLLVSS